MIGYLKNSLGFRSMCSRLDVSALVFTILNIHAPTFYFVTCVGDWAKTATGEDFLLAEDGHADDKIIIFGTQGNVKILKWTPYVIVHRKTDHFPQKLKFKLLLLVDTSIFAECNGS